MTEAEALKKWCPFARVGSETSGLGALNRDGVRGPLKEARCIASACMAWRSETPEIERRWAAEGEPAPGPDWEPDIDATPSKDKRFSQAFWRRNPSGYCGLAGAPQ